MPGAVVPAGLVAVLAVLGAVVPAGLVAVLAVLGAVVPTGILAAPGAAMGTTRRQRATGRGRLRGGGADGAGLNWVASSRGR